MRVFVIGGGGREHSLVWKISKSPLVDEIYCVPGNAGISELAHCVNFDIHDNDALAGFAQAKKIDLTVVGPEVPLVGGITDVFEARGLRIFGPRKQAALIEGSKSFAKAIMKKYGIPTGDGVVFTGYEEAVAYVKRHNSPFAVKADGLAGGKGVTVVFDQEAAIGALRDCFIHAKFGSAGKKVIIEEYLEGEEVSVFAFTDGRTVLPMIPAQDYKRVFDGDRGPNTGGMGSYSPVSIITKEIYEEIITGILEPAIAGLFKEGLEYRGVLYGGLILTSEGPKVLEFNCRFGDPESQAILPLLESDLVEIMLAVTEGNLSGYKLQWLPGRCVTVVIASGGYPEDYRRGFEITGLKEASEVPGVQIFHAGTTLEDGKPVTAGGRVLNVSAVGSSFEEARKRAYEAVGKIHFEGMHYRRDIALRATQEEGRL
ncbi:MAG: phosphoribosylamine--glycine ligase [Actinomycetota bacterium]